MKILILGSKEYPFGTNKGDDPIPSGGMETYVNDLVPELSKLCKISIITRKFNDTKKYEKKGNIEIHRVCWLKGKWFRNPTFNKMSFLKALIISGDIDIFYSNGLVSGFSALLLSKILTKKSIYRPAGIAFNQFNFPMKNILHWFEGLVFRNSDGIVFHSVGEKKNAIDYFGKNIAESFVILTGFPIKKFNKRNDKIKKEFNIKNEIVIATVARFVPVKGLEYLLNAVSKIETDYKLLMIGSGPEEENLKGLAKTLKIKDKVIFTGFRHDVPNFLGITDIYVISSFSEGLPTSLLEAIAAKSACVVTDIGLPIENEKTGLVVKPKDDDDLSRAIIRLIDNESLRKELGENAYDFVKNNCTQKMAAKSHYKAFNSILKH